jgi:hypothetical protein
MLTCSNMTVLLLARALLQDCCGQQSTLRMEAEMRHERHESVGGSVFGGYGFLNYTPAASSRPSHIREGSIHSDESDEPWLSSIWQQASQMLARITRG